MLILLGFLIAITLSISAQAQSTSIFFQNNTELEFGVTAVQSGTHTMDANEWSLKATDVEAWEMRKELLETNRNNGIHNGETFYFDVYVWHGTDTLQLQLKLEGNFIGSDMEHSLEGSNFNHPWYDDGGFHEESLMFGNLPVTVKYKPDGTDAFFNRDIVFAIQDNRPKYTIDSADFSNPNVINVLSYNIKFLPPPIGTFDAAERADVIPRYISPYQDVVIFQEAFEDAARNNNLVPAMQAAGFSYQTDILNDGQIIENGGVIIFSRWPIELEDEYDYRSCDNNSGDCFAAKGILYAKINKLGKKYHVFGTHMEAGGNPNDIAIKKEQFGEQRDFIAAQNIPVDEAVILGGDMNTDASSVQYPDLIDSLNPIIGLHKGFHASTDVTRDSGNIIDHIWGDRKHLVPIDCYTKVWVYRAIDDDLWDIFDPSDHLPVNGRFEYPDVDTPVVATIEICGSGSLQLTAPMVHPDLLYQWFLDSMPLTGATNASYNNSLATANDTGRYSCRIRTQFTVEDTSALGHPNWPDTAVQYFDFEIAHVVHIPIDMNPIITQQSDTLFSSASTGNQWYDANGLIAGATDSFYVLTQLGNYYTVVNQGNCTSNPSNSITYTNLSLIKEMDVFKIYPNPAYEQVIIEVLPQTEKLEIIDPMGRIQQIELNQNTISRISLKGWSQGIYWVKLTHPNKVYVKSFSIN